VSVCHFTASFSLRFSNDRTVCSTIGALGWIGRRCKEHGEIRDDVVDRCYVYSLAKNKHFRSHQTKVAGAVTKKGNPVGGCQPGRRRRVAAVARRKQGSRCQDPMTVHRTHVRRFVPVGLENRLFFSLVFFYFYPSIVINDPRKLPQRQVDACLLLLTVFEVRYDVSMSWLACEDRKHERAGKRCWKLLTHVP
jgi:hypothetical protein